MADKKLTLTLSEEDIIEIIRNSEFVLEHFFAFDPDNIVIEKSEDEDTFEVSCEQEVQEDLIEDGDEDEV